MGTITTELVPDSQTRDGRGHRLTTAERRAELLHAYDLSGLSRAAFARREGIQYATFANWVQRRAAVPTPRTTAKPKPANNPVRFTELRLATRSNLEVVLPGGLLVRGTDAAAVATLVRALVAGS